MISWVMPVNPSHPYLENDPAPSFAPTICAFHLGFSLGGVDMAQQRIGMVVTADDSNAALRAVEDLDNRGIGAAWMTSGSTGGGDSLSVFAAAGPGPGASCSAQP